MSALYSLFRSVEAAGQRQRSVVRRLEVTADGVVAAEIGLEESTPLLYLERLRLADEQPLALDRVWLPAAIAEPLLAVDFSHTSLHGELAARCGVRVDAGQERVRAVVPSATSESSSPYHRTRPSSPSRASDRPAARVWSGDRRWYAATVLSSRRTSRLAGTDSRARSRPPPQLGAGPREQTATGTDPSRPVRRRCSPAARCCSGRWGAPISSMGGPHAGNDACPVPLRAAPRRHAS